MRVLPGAVAVLVAAVVASPAGAVVQPASKTFTSTGAEQTFVVPPGVNVVRVTAVGGRGGNGTGATGIGGLGARVTGALAVTPGQTLYVEVGENGATGGPAAFNGGAAPGAAATQGGAGGGASDVRTSPRADGDASRVLVAGGGGGGGGTTGTGGAAGQAGGNGAFSAGGGAGTGSAGGAGGAGAQGGAAGAAGAPGAGGRGGDGPGGGTSGGGGGGGLFGGGGGGGATNSGGGGGGGSSLAPQGGTVEADTTGTPQVRLEWDDVGIATVAPGSIAFGPQLARTTSASQRVTLTNTGGAPLTLGATSLSGPNANEFAFDAGCAGTLAAGASCAVFVRFASLGTRAATATLTVASDTPGGLSSVGLSGTGAFVSDPLLPPPVAQLTRLKLSRTTFRAATRGASIAARPRGTTVTYRLSRPAKVTFAVTRMRGKRSVVLGTFAVTDRTAGAQRHAFRARLKGRALKPGRYVLRATPERGTAVRTPFRVVRR